MDKEEVMRCYDDVQIAFNIIDALAEAGYFPDEIATSPDRVHEPAHIIAKTIKAYRENENG